METIRLDLGCRFSSFFLQEFGFIFSANTHHVEVYFILTLQRYFVPEGIIGRLLPKFFGSIV